MIEHEPGDAVAVVEREPHDRVRAHRGARQHGALDPAVVEHGEQVGGERLVAVSSGSAPGRAAVAARVVGDHAVPAALERARAHHHVAARRGQAVQQHDGDRPRRPPRRPASTPARSTVNSDTLGSLERVIFDATEADFEQDVIERSRAAARGRRLLGRVVRPVPPAHAGARAGRDRARRQARAGEGRHGRQPAPRRGVPDPGHPGGQGVQGRPRSRPSSPARSRPPWSRASSTRCCRPRPTRSSRRAARTTCAARSSSSRAAPTPAWRSRGILRDRGEREDALAILAEFPGSFAAEGLAARLRLEEDEELRDAFAALDDGEQQRGLDALIAAIADARRRAAARTCAAPSSACSTSSASSTRVARESRRKLASALY